MRQTPSQDPNIVIQHASWPAERSSHSIPLHEAKDPDRIWTQDTRSWKPQQLPRRILPYPRESQTHGSPVLCPREALMTSYCGPSSPDEPGAIPGPPHISDRLHNNLLELSRRRVRDPRSFCLGCLYGCTISRRRNRMNNAWSARTPTLTELHAGNKS
jgi:hypothetical protein